HVEPAARVLRLKRREERRLAAGHLWVFSNEIDTASTPLTAFDVGAVAELRTSRDAFLGYVCVNPHALICARILSRDAAQPVDRALIERRLATTLVLREKLGKAQYCRWVFGESDLLPGLVLDRYGDLVVGQIATAGMEALKHEIEAAVRSVASPRARCVLVCRRLGGRGAAPWRGSGALRRRLGGGARARTAQRRAQQCRARGAARRRLRCPEVAWRAGRALRGGDSRSARVHQ